MGVQRYYCNYLLYLPTLSFVLYLLTNVVIHKLRNLPPTPFPCLPFVGHLYLLNTKPLHKALCQIANRFGPLVYLKLGSRRVLVVSSPSAAEECLATNDMVFANRPSFLFGKHFGYNYTSMAWSSYGDHWRNLRRMSAVQVLSSNRIQMLSYIRAEEVRILIRKLFLGFQENPAKALDMKSTLFDFTFNVMTRMIMGKRYYGENVDNAVEARVFHRITEETAEVKDKANRLDFLPLMRWFGMGDVEGKLMKIQERRDMFMQSLVEECRDNNYNKMMKKSGSSTDNKKNIMEVLLDLHETQPDYYTEELVRNLMLVLLQAGSDTSAITLKWAFTVLVDNPKILKRAQSDIDEVVGKERLLEDSDIEHLPYLRQIVYETLRLYPPAPLLMPHRSSKECRVGGYHIPSDTILLVNVWAIQHDPKVWEDPHTFRPERFEHADKEFKFLTFGSGRRGCPGESLAHRLIALALGCLIQCFDWERVVVSSDDEFVDVVPERLPLMARCYPRSSIAKLISS